VGFAGKRGGKEGRGLKRLTARRGARPRTRVGKKKKRGGAEGAQRPKRSRSGKHRRKREKEEEKKGTVLHTLPAPRSAEEKRGKRKGRSTLEKTALSCPPASQKEGEKKKGMGRGVLLYPDR